LAVKGPAVAVVAAAEEVLAAVAVAVAEAEAAVAEAEAVAVAEAEAVAVAAAGSGWLPVKRIISVVCGDRDASFLTHPDLERIRECFHSKITREVNVCCSWG
jgi:regulator of protease activity HflC (stomatin/prohibitin superfamily)